MSGSSGLTASDSRVSARHHIRPLITASVMSVLRVNYSVRATASGRFGRQDRSGSVRETQSRRRRHARGPWGDGIVGAVGHFIGEREASPR